MARPEYYSTRCHCGAPVRFYPEEIINFLRLSYAFLPCGHGVSPSKEGRADAVRWLTDHYPELLYPQAAKKGETKPAAPKAPEPTDAEKEAALKAKLEDIDNFLARRGKYAPEAA